MRCPTSRRPRPDVSRREVVVTGLGATTPLGGDVASTWEALVAKAGVHAPTSACATGAEAVAWALDILRSGRADVAVAGGTEAVIHPLPLAGFAAMRAMSTRNDDPEAASRPFDKGRDGFVLGEGSGAMVLETEEHA